MATFGAMCSRMVCATGLALVAILPGAIADDHIVLPPVVTDASLPEKMFIFIPGGLVPNDHYVKTGEAIQKAATNLRLWVAIPAVFRRLCIISCTTRSTCAPLHSDIESTLDLAVQKGWKRGSDAEDLWMAGHSLGGTCANTVFQAYSEGANGSPYAGLIVMGSYVDESGDFDVTHFPRPVLTLNTELDGGLARPGKTATWWRQHEGLAAEKGADFALTQKPVLVLPGLNHSDFCPGFDVKGDLPAEVSQADATELIAKTVASFLHVQTPAAPQAVRDSGLALLREKATWTRSLLGPYLKAQDMERTLGVGEGSSPFCEAAQRIIAGLSKSDDARLKVGSTFHVSSPNLEHCHPNWTHTEADGLKVMTCGHADYYLDVANTGSITAASEIACKLLTSSRIVEQLKTKAADPKATCKMGNQHAVQIAEGIAPEWTLKRYKSKGRGWCFLDDIPTFGNIGPVWVFKDSLTLTEESTCMSVASPVLLSELDSKIYPGNHYCKYLSPARVLDWMMTDSLKKLKALEEAPLLV